MKKDRKVLHRSNLLYKGGRTEEFNTCTAGDHTTGLSMERKGDPKKKNKTKEGLEKEGKKLWAGTKDSTEKSFGKKGGLKNRKKGRKADPASPARIRGPRPGSHPPVPRKREREPGFQGGD